jgi:hypothetical protein
MNNEPVERDPRKILSTISAVRFHRSSQFGPYEELLVARIDFLGKVVARADLGNDVPADIEKSLQQGVVKFQNFDVPSPRSCRSDRALLALNSARARAYSGDAQVPPSFEQ